MSDLIQGVTNGKLEETASSASTSSKKTSNSELGKEDFLMLLVTQMKYQDPLSPTDNTQYVSQLATFSQLEQMQNMNQTTLNTQAFSLVGKEVIMQTTTSSGNTTQTQGVVDYVTVNGTKTYLSINDALYSYEDLYMVIDDNYSISKKLPSVEALSASYNHSEPEDINVNLTLGEDEYEASMVAVYLNGEAVESGYLTYKDGTLTIDKDAFKNLEAGNYTVAFIFNDQLTTVVADKVTVRVTGIKPEGENTDSTEGTDSAESTESEEVIE